MSDPSPAAPRRRAIDWDLWAGAVFALFGIVLCVHAWDFPRGTRGVPGPGFFPIVIGLLLIVLSLALIATTRRTTTHDYWARAHDGPVLPRIGAILLLLIVYISFWNVVPFVARTPLLLIAIYRLLGESWPRTVLLAILLTMSLYAVFEGLLSVQL